MTERPTVSELRKAAHASLRAFSGLIHNVFGNPPTAQSKPIHDAEVAVEFDIHALADRLGQEIEANKLRQVEWDKHYADCHMNSNRVAREEAEREVERLRLLVSDAAHELVSRGASAYAERLRAALRGGDRE